MTTRARSTASPRDVDVITYEFENVPADDRDASSSARRPVLPDPAVLATTQDRLVEKTFISDARHRRPRPSRRSTRRSDLDAGARGDRPPGGAEDAALRLRRQGPGRRSATAPICAAAWREIGGAAGDPRSLRAVRARDLGGRRARRRRRASPASTSPRTSTATTSSRSRRVPAAVSRPVAAEASAHRRAHRRGVRLCRRARGRDVRGRGRRGPRRAGQRDRAAGAQFRPLDHRRLRRLAIRAAHPRGRRLAARRAGAPWRGSRWST